jgi:hypothetical protein
MPYIRDSWSQRIFSMLTSRAREKSRRLNDSFHTEGWDIVNQRWACFYLSREKGKSFRSDGTPTYNGSCLY